MPQKSKTIRFVDDNDETTSELGKDKKIEKGKEDKEMEKVKPTTLQQKMLAMAGQDIDQFMREMEVVHKKRETERAQDLNARLSLLDSDLMENSINKTNNERDNENLEKINLSSQSSQHPAGSLQHQHGLPPFGMPPPSLLYRPPPPPMHLRMPPPPPPRIGIRLPPGKYHHVPLVCKIYNTLN